LALQLDDNAEIGQGLVCDTANQLERFLMLRNEGRDTESAIQIINQQVESPVACGIITVAFIIHEVVKQGTMHGYPVSITKITVIAISSGTQWHKVPATTQYTIFGKGDSAL
jgi:hypothetical protein